MYLEGVKNGRRLLRQVTDINRKKPVIILKGGLTASGARAVASHTGSLAGGEKIWKAFFRQSGAVQVDSLEEMTDVTLAFLNLGESGGKRVAVIGTGGGIGVAAADSCAKVGLDLPLLPMAIMNKLREFIPPAGNMIRNPIDAHLVFLELDLLGQTLDLCPPGQPLICLSSPFILTGYLKMEQKTRWKRWPVICRGGPETYPQQALGCCLEAIPAQPGTKAIPYHF